jgi:hypothetical protein
MYLTSGIAVVLTVLSASTMRFADVASRCMWELNLNTRFPCTVRAVV